MIFPEDEMIKSNLLTATSHTSEVKEYRGKIECICVRSLIADSDVAFSGRYHSTNTNLHLTIKEFEKILENLYERGYVLVDVEDLIDQSDPTFLLERNLKVPKGKKPLIVVIEDLQYGVADYRCGTCRRLVLNDENQVCGEYQNNAGETVVSRTAEAIGLLDVFVEKNPDFTYDGAKGIISVSGHEACFGYVVAAGELEDRNAALSAANLPHEDIDFAREKVMEIKNVLADNGWKFASCTYSYIADCRNTEKQVLIDDFVKWQDQIGSLFGEVHILVYPNGNYIYGTDDRAVYFKNRGFRIFFGGGATPYHIYDSTVDDYTYIAANSRISMTDVGKFCSIGPNLLCGYGIHPTDGVSTSPMFYSTLKQNGTTLSKEDKIIERKRIIIGNDVFIGMNVTVLDGVTIGDGAIIGAGAVVSKDIPPYAIAVGCPIRIIRYRFNEDTVQQFLHLKWWDKDEDCLRLVEKQFFNPELFLEEASK